MSLRPKMRYPSDLTDSQWAKMESLVPPARSMGRHRTVSPRDIANAINYRWETGCVWRMLPHDFPPWGTVYAYFRDWQRAGVIRQLREILLEAPSKSQPRRGQPTTSPSWPADDSPQDRTESGRSPLGHSSSSPPSADGFSPLRRETDRIPPAGSRPANLLD